MINTPSRNQINLVNDMYELLDIKEKVGFTQVEFTAFINKYSEEYSQIKSRILKNRGKIFHEGSKI